jgi:hypothetical protein
MMQRRNAGMEWLGENEIKGIFMDEITHFINDSSLLEKRNYHR